MAASRLSLYQGACLALGERKVVSLTENVPARKELDGVWDRNGLTSCLQMALWNFATRSVQLDYSPSVSPTFGYRRAFEKPTDFVRLTALSGSEYFSTPLNEFTDEAAYWFCDLDTIYVRYVSKDGDYGYDFAKWPENFARYVEHFFAFQVCERLTGSGRKKEDVGSDMESWLKIAKGTDAAEEPTAFIPHGSWSQSRGYGYSRSRFSGPYRTR